MLKVLLVEDENLIRRGLQYKMDWTEVNCVVVGEAATGQEGLTQIKALRPDIVITDIRMPDMDGLEMLREGRAVCPFHAIIISGYGEFDYAQQAIRLGEDGSPGVYVIEGANAVFKPVTILYDNGETYVVQEDRSSTDYLWVGSEIIVSARNLYNGKVVK